MTLEQYNTLFSNGVIKNVVITTSSGYRISNRNICSEQMSLEESLCSEHNLHFGSCESDCFTIRIADLHHSFVGEWFDVDLQLNVSTDGYLLNESGGRLLFENGFPIMLESSEQTIKLGRFKVYSDQPTNDYAWRDITAYDIMYDIINENVAEWWDDIVFPVTLKNLRDSFFEYIGVPQEDITLINDTMEVQGGFTTDSQLSGKTIIESICELNGVFGHINKEGVFTYISLPTNDSIKLKWYVNGSGSYEDYVVKNITGITARDSVDDAGSIVGSNENVYYVDDNPLTYGLEGTQALTTALTKLLNKIRFVSYRPFVASTYGNPMLPIGTSIRVETSKQNIDSYIITRTLSGIQNMKDRLYASGEQYRPSDLNNLQTEIKRNKGKTHELTVDVNQLKSDITTIENDIETIEGDLGNVYTKTETNTLLEQTESTITQSVSQTYETKTDATDKLNTANTNAQTYATNAENSSKSYADGIGSSAVATSQNYTDTKLTSYDTKTEVNAKIQTSEQGILQTVSTTYVNNNTFTTTISQLQSEIDGAIETFSGTDVPTLNNYPASSWSTPQIKASHVGDLYVVSNDQSAYDGFYYRFTYDETTQTYSWELLRDSEITKALADAAEANAKAQAALDSLANNYWNKTETESRYTQADNAITQTITTNYTRDIANASETFTESDSYSVLSDSSEVSGFILTENGGYLLLEDGGKMIIDIGDNILCINVTIPSNITLADGKYLGVWLDEEWGNYSNYQKYLKITQGQTVLDAVPIYYDRLTILTNEYDQASIMHLVYRSQKEINGNYYTGWWIGDGSVYKSLKTQIEQTDQKIDLMVDNITEGVHSEIEMNERQIRTYVGNKIDTETEITLTPYAYENYQDGSTNYQYIYTYELDDVADGRRYGFFIPEELSSIDYEKDYEKQLRVIVRSDEGSLARFVPIYYTGDTPLTNQYAANAYIHLIYKTNVTVSTEVPGSGGIIITRVIDEGFWVGADESFSEIVQTRNTLVLKVDNSGKIVQVALGATPSGSALQIGADNIDLSANDVFNIMSGGTLDLTGKTISIRSDYFTVDAEGHITSTGGKIGGWDIASNALYNGMTSLSDTTHDGVWIGQDGIALGKGKFKVTNAGAVTASNLTISGGSININSNFIVDSSGNLTMKAGSINLGNGKFQVSSAGALTSTSGKIGGWSIGTNSLSIINSSGNYVTISDGTNSNQDVFVVRTGSAGSYRYPFYIRANGQVSCSNLSISGGSINLGSGVFQVNSSGAVTCSNITATGGKVGGWNILSTYLSYGNAVLTNTHLRVVRNNTDFITFGNQAITYTNGAILSTKTILNYLNPADSNSYVGKTFVTKTNGQCGDSVSNTSGYIMHGRAVGHTYQVNWTGSQLDFYVDQTGVGTLSDKRLKKDIKDVDNKLIEAINDCPMKQYKADNRGGLVSFGIIAQDLVQACADRDIDILDYEILQKKHYKDGDDTEYYMIDNGQLAILEIQALKKEIKELRRIINNG